MTLQQLAERNLVCSTCTLKSCAVRPLTQEDSSVCPKGIWLEQMVAKAMEGLSELPVDPAPRELTLEEIDAHIRKTRPDAFDTDGVVLPFD